MAIALVLLVAILAAQPAPRCAEAIPDILDRLSPAVVYISATSMLPGDLPQGALAPLTGGMRRPRDR